ncbi:hypothetical protein ES703_82326 [subsurface metagenome]
MDRAKILIAGSDPGFVEAAREALQGLYAMGTAYSVNEALNRAKEERPEMVIIGFLEPRGRSFELHKQLRADLITEDIPLLVVDVRPEEHSRKGWRKNEGMQLDAEGYITQPIEPGELRQAAARIIGRAVQKEEATETIDQVVAVLEQIKQVEKQLAK